VLPVDFLEASGFTVLKDDPRYPLLRLDTREERQPIEAMEAVEVEVPVADAVE
jgi:hypothetical protein